ncbi:MAG: diguanylate cyclase [Chloroflexi bacterium]|nr:diguanylate cyclase [Chloroflexota bacterium]
MATSTPRAARLLGPAIDALDAPLAILDSRGCIIFTNAAWNDAGREGPLFGAGFPPGSFYIEACRAKAAEVGEGAALLGASIQTLLDYRREAIVLEYNEGPAKQRWFQARLTRFGDDASPCVVVAHYDVTDLKVAEEALEHRALYDALTGLPNRVLLADRLASAISLARREAKIGAVMIMDLDRFKEVNDTLGHHAGDLVLQEVARRVSETLRDTDTVARLGGDEFGIVLTGLVNVRQVTIAVDKILQSFATPFQIEGHNADVGASIGIAVFPDHGHEPENLMRRADVAMYTAKREGLGQYVYSPDGKGDGGLDRSTLVSGLREAMERNEFLVFFQPKIGRDSSITAVHLDLAWDAPEQGRLTSEQFIPLAERTGLIKPFTHWSLNTALRQCHVWDEAGTPMVVSISMPSRVLQDTQIPTAVARLLRSYALQPQRLQIEVEESSFAAEHVFETVSRLRDLGVGLCITEFDNGYSGVPMLQRLAIRQITLPRALIRGAVTSEEDAEVLTATIELAHGMGLQVGAAGVDTAEIQERAVALGCDLLQGSHVAPHMSLDKFEQWLHTRDAATEEPEPGLPSGFTLPTASSEPASNLSARPASELLAQISLFNLLDTRDLEELAAVTRRRTCEAGDVIFRKEDPGYTLYLIVSGAVKISDPSPKGGEVILAILRSGQFFGELSLFDDEPRSADARAVEPTELLALSREDLLKVLDRRQSVTVHLFKVLSQRLRATNETLREITSLSLPGRIAKRLLDLADILGERRPEGFLIPLVLGPEEISNMIGAPSGEVDRVLETFRFGGLLQDVNDGVLLINEPDLQSISLG